MQQDGLSLRRRSHVPQESVNSGQHCEQPSALQWPRHISTVETDDNGNIKFVVDMERRMEEKMIGYIPSSLRSSVDNAVNLISENTFSLDGDDLPGMSTSNSVVESAKRKSGGGKLMSAWNGDTKLIPDRHSSVQSASTGRLKKSSSFSLTHIPSSLKRKSSDEETKACAVLSQSRSASESICDGGRSQSEVVVKNRQSLGLELVNAEVASEDAGDSVGHLSLRVSGDRKVTGITTKSTAHRPRRTRNNASTDAIGAKQSTNSVLNETVVVENSQLTAGVSASEVKPSCESRVNAGSNQTGTNVVSSKSAQSRKSTPGIPDSKYGSTRLSMSRIPAGSRKRENQLKVSGKPSAVESSGSRGGRLSTSSSSSLMSSQSVETKARVSVSVSDSTRFCIPKPSGTFHK